VLELTGERLSELQQRAEPLPFAVASFALIRRTVRSSTRRSTSAFSR